MMQAFEIGPGEVLYARPDTVGATEEECRAILGGEMDPERFAHIVQNVQLAAFALVNAENPGHC